MKTKILGRTGLELSIVGIGTAFTGIPSTPDTLRQYVDDPDAEDGPKPDDMPNPVDEELGVQTLITALDEGCTFIDTALLYGRTVSEKMIGIALNQRPELKENVIVTTKVGRRYDGYDYSFDAVVSGVHESLERMGLDYLEVAYIHDPMGFPMEDILGKDRALGALRHLQDQGIVKHIGTAANDPATNVEYIKTGEFSAAVIADSWSLLNQTALKEIFPAAEKHNVGLVTATPIERGLLVTGPVDGIDYLNRNFSQDCLDHVVKIQSLCRDYNITMLAVALQWCTRHPQVTSTIPGARTPEEAKSSLNAAEINIPEAFWNDLEPMIRHFDVVPR